MSVHLLPYTGGMKVCKKIVSPKSNFHQMSRQIFVVDGDMQLNTHPSTDGSTLGQISFVAEDKSTLGKLKIFGGGPGYYRLVLDTSSVYRGISFRTTPKQGGPQEGGENLPYTANFQNAYIELNNNTSISPHSSAYGDTSAYLLQVKKTQDSNTYSLDSFSQFNFMDTYRAGQSLNIALGQSGNYRTVWGYRNPAGGTPSETSYGYHGMSLSSSPYLIEAIRYYKSGLVEVPKQLACPTLISSGNTLITSFATNPENLVTADPGSLCMDTTHGILYIKSTGTGTTGWTVVGASPDLTPITLDKTNNRVGINTTSPMQALDVTGNAQVSGWIMASEVDTNNLAAVSITTSTINAGTYLNLPPPDVLPITLDKTNNRVGINTTNPQHALHVIGTSYFNDVINTGTVSIGTGAGTPEGARTANVGSLFMRSDGGTATTLYTKVSGTGNTGWQVVGSQPYFTDKTINSTPYTITTDDIRKRLVVTTPYPTTQIIKLQDNNILPVNTQIGIYTPYTSTTIQNIDIQTYPGINGVVTCSYIYPDGKILLGGNFTLPTSRVARFNADRTVDTSFLDPAINNQVESLYVDGAGGIYVGGSFTASGATTRNRFLKLQTNGSLDTTFPDLNLNGIVYAITQRTADSKLVLGGAFTTPRQRLLVCSSTGAVDTFVNTAINGNIYCIAAAPSGSIFVGGDFTTIGGVAQSGLAFLDVWGAASWANPNITGGPVRCIRYISNSDFYVGGDFTSVGGTSYSKYAHLKFNFVVDTTIPNLGLASTDSIKQIVPYGVGSLIVGTITTVQGVGRNGIALLSSSGYLLPNFSICIDSNKVLTCSIFSSNAIFLGGSFLQINNQTVSYQGVVTSVYNGIQTIKTEPWLTTGTLAQYSNIILEKLQDGVWVITKVN